MSKQKEKVAVAMSGGVDSSVAAAILLDQGYDCFGVFMHFWSEPGGDKQNKCCSLESFEEARRVAQKLGIKIYTLNFKDLFKEKIVDDFLKLYGNCQTPNPCVRCNKYIKFGALLKKVKAMGADYLATGHYIRKIPNSKFQISNKSQNQNPKPQTYQLFVAEDREKDQTYFLYNLKKSDLKHLLFPVGNYKKTEVRKLAAKYKLPVATRPDSQEVCFVGNKDHNQFLKKYLKVKPGNIVTTDGKIVGQHLGLPLYTIGQRKGVGLGNGPFYVVGFKTKTNQLVVTKNPADPQLYSNDLVAKSVSWVSGKEPRLPFKCIAKIRYRHEAIPVVVTKKSGKIVVQFKKPQRAITPGQSVVFYKKNKNSEELLGGGVII